MQRKINTPAWVAGNTIYEVNLRQFTKEGTIKAFEEHLPRLKELGVGILWFMPIQPIGKKNRKGTLGSYYSISDYKKVNPEFGTIDDFKSLVKKIHDLNMKVIIDWVANHTAWDHDWTVDHPEFYSKDENGNFKAPVEDWEDVIHLDYGNPDLWDTMISDMQFWINEAGIDGFRCDMAHLVPTLFWNRARRDLDKIKPVYMLAESENFDLLEYAFDTIYNWKLMHAMNEVAAGTSHANQLGETISNEFNYLPKGASFMNFTSNHDENSWQGSAIERIHYFLEPLTVLTFLIPGMPLIYSGQEAGNYRRLKFFDKDEIEWKDDKMFELFQKLAELKGKLPNFSNKVEMRIVNSDASEKILCIALFENDAKCLFLLNLSDKAVDFYVKCQQLEGPFRNAIQQEVKTGYSCHNQFKLSAFGYLILVK
ncbi:MAG TPA: alpha-amylase family glycosyl hydrolase [Bacteroidales bacterium]|nr:alpha-amylase family glycosyl hydrolase [Bacteroidales bacterium]HRX96916.1 alpha-amylase family glycosyl hydrolase [Bacteroidales bacterium]